MRGILSQFYLHGDSMRQDDDFNMAGEKKWQGKLGFELKPCQFQGLLGIPNQMHRFRGPS